MLEIVAILFSSPAISNGAAEQVVREQRTVMVQGVEETWELVWDGKPSTVCAPDEVDMAITCPCSGWAYGEYGKLLLVRRRAGEVVDRMDLRPLFGKFDYPEYEKVKGTAYLQRWPFRDSDIGREDDPTLTSEILRRPPSSIMKFADYDRDGEATEFLIQVGTMPCGKHYYSAVGVSRRNLHLHALSTAENPDSPLAMPLDAWEALLKSPGPTKVPTWECGDHASHFRSELLVSAKNGEIHARWRDFPCSIKGASAKPASQKDL